MSQAENLIHANLIPGGEAYAQDIDDQINHFVDRINERVESADCVSTNTANKIVKRDASGNFAAGTITANLVGNVTGNMTGNVTGNVTGNLTGLAEAAKGDTRFQLSGNVGGDAPFILSPLERRGMQVIFVTVPGGKVLKLKRIRYNLGVTSHTILQVMGRIYEGTEGEWMSVVGDNENDLTPNATIRTSSGLVYIELYNTSNSVNSYTHPDWGWWLDLAIEDA